MATLNQLHLFVQKIAIDHDGPLTNGEPCWLWTGCRFTTTGYGALSRDNKTQSAHRWFWLSIGNIAIAGRVLDHLCRVRRCVNPHHLEQVTEKVNINRGEGGLPKETCDEGHGLSGQNLYVSPKGMRQCVICRNRRSREFRARKWERMSEADRDAQRTIWRNKNKMRRDQKKAA